ncbi:epimerase [Niastella koreensis]|uniref:NAD-dependent epimerase/dehydratase n=2 Tax=Niastella koreensis TaxID=354356 RepID=G8T9A8_NIAKG|nr:aldehyde reductase [Niastella koreensis]AEV98076.1 NAD-dependent epimerase/dehydratase [Niastella koreensis GR20-10]OQP40127.1 epimerase [Niastella koreensis]
MENTKGPETVLVTGGSGFIASYCIIELLKKGYRVKATLRSLNRVADVKQMLSVGGIRDFENLSFVQVDLSQENGWMEAAKGCTYVIHPASPTPNVAAKHEDEFIIPAVNGVLFVLRAAKAAGVKRVVLTSAFGAIGMGTDKKSPYTEEDWSDLTQDMPPYQKSKTLSEKAAWEYIAGEGKGLELAVVNPVGVLGPVLGSDYSHSIQTIHQMLKGALKGVPRIRFVYVDVRDVADLHVKAMINPAANGQRFLATSGNAVTVLDIANMLRAGLGANANKVPAKELPNWLIRAIALFNPKVRLVVPHLGMVKEASHKKASLLLGWQPRSIAEAVLATGQSLIDLGLV